MKLFLKLLMIFCALFPTKIVYAEENIFARSYVIMEQNSGKIIESKDCNLVRSVASVSKIMTAIIAIESNDLFKSVEIGDEIDQAIGSSLYLEKGTKVDIIELVYGLLLRSGNDAAMAIAKNVGGSVDKFVEMMNDKARLIGMKNTTFNNPSGLDMFDEGNLSTSYDLALMMRYAMSNKLFREIDSSKSYKSLVKGTWYNKHKLLQNYEYAIGGKTGYTKKARRTLITSACKDNLELIVVTLDCGNDFSLHKQLFEKYFNNYTYVPFLNKGMNYILNYEFYSNKSYGILIKNELVENAIKIYKLNSKNNTISMFFKLSNGTLIEIGRTTLASVAVVNA